MSVQFVSLLTAGPLVVLISALMTGMLRRLALRAGMMDVPNERSSHSQPTPRGGGLSICLCVLGALPVLYAAGWLSRGSALAIGCGGILVSVIGWLEDRHGVALIWRALGYLAAAALALYFLLHAGASSGGVNFRPRYLLYVLGIPAMGWLINLYNFMDGTDALAGVETVTAATWAALFFFYAGQTGPAWICIVLSAASIGFLYWNWPPARIFMGDSGSCFVGFTFGVLAVIGWRSGAVPLSAWCILLAVFICDSSLTLLKRVVAGEKWYTPHRSHAYQILVQSGMTHRRLALYTAGINFLLLGPLAGIALYIHALPAAAGTVFAAASVTWAIVQHNTPGGQKTPS